MVQYPIILQSIFETWTITRRYNAYEDMEKWLDENHLELISSIQVGEYLCCIAKAMNIQKVEKIL